MGDVITDISPSNERYNVWHRVREWSAGIALIHHRDEVWRFPSSRFDREAMPRWWARGFHGARMTAPLIVIIARAHALRIAEMRRASTWLHSPCARWIGRSDAKDYSGASPLRYYRAYKQSVCISRAIFIQSSRTGIPVFLEIHM